MALTWAHVAVESPAWFDQPLGSQLVVGVGGVIVRMNKIGDLPNAFGGRDIYGGKVDRGFAEIRLAAVEGKILVLEVLDINKQSPETTMDRYSPLVRTGVVDVDVNQSINIQTGEGAEPHRLRLDTTMQQDFVIAGVRVTFLEVQPYSVRYTLEDLQAE